MLYCSSKGVATMDKEMLEQFQILFQAIQDVKNEVKESETRVMDYTNSKIKESETRIKVYVENEVSKRIDALFDGYKLTHEKQWELERKTDEMQRQIENLQNRLSVIENSIA